MTEPLGVALRVSRTFPWGAAGFASASGARRADEVDDRYIVIMSNKIVYNESLKPYAQQLRREMTRQERHLWYDFLRSYPVMFRRQKSFGNYIADFYCAAAKLVVEIDGSQHYEPYGRENDEKRDRYLSGLGLSVLRFSNYEVDCQFEGVCAQIDGEVKRKRGQDGE